MNDSKDPINPANATSIDTSPFVASGLDLRQLVLEQDIHASARRIFAAFADGPSFKQAYGPDRSELRADIELKIGGKFEWLFDGVTGSNGCQILSYVPDRMISFSWNAPPTQAANRHKRTWVVVELSPVEGGTRVRLTHLGFGEGPEWQETYEYFEAAWKHVLSTFKANLET